MLFLVDVLLERIVSVTENINQWNYKIKKSIQEYSVSWLDVRQCGGECALNEKSKLVCVFTMHWVGKMTGKRGLKDKPVKIWNRKEKKKKAILLTDKGL